MIHRNCLSFKAGNRRSEIRRADGYPEQQAGIINLSTAEILILSNDALSRLLDPMPKRAFARMSGSLEQRRHMSDCWNSRHSPPLYLEKEISFDSTVMGVVHRSIYYMMLRTRSGSCGLESQPTYTLRSGRIVSVKALESPSEIRGKDRVIGHNIPVAHENRIEFKRSKSP